MENMVTVRTVYENEVIRLLEPAELEEGQEIEVVASHKKSGTTGTERKPSLHAGSTQMSDDFDDPLLDSFWLGEVHE
ncbi:MAG: antitoxin family protein [Anaerolineae bacterium]|nr:antitoxin family protein [Anaerolineae bacterium]